jgi:uncharacterized membrane protein
MLRTFPRGPQEASLFRHRCDRAVAPGMCGMAIERDQGPRLPGTLLGIGLGGLVDGIVLHQILQWHHMLSDESDYPTTTIDGLEANTLADGVFHAATWVVVAIGIWIMWRRTSDWRWATNGRALSGWIVVGWGLFNVVEGVVDHQILGIHHVRDDIGGPLSWDIGFLITSCLAIALGWLLATSGRPRRRAGITHLRARR